MIIRYLTSTICIFLLLWGCDRSVDATAQPKVVRKKVVAQEEQIAKAGTKKRTRAARTTDVATNPKVVRKKIVAQKVQIAKAGTKKRTRAARMTDAVTNPKVVRKKIVAQKVQIAKARANKKNRTAKTTEAAVNSKVVRKKVVAQKAQTAKVRLNKTVGITKTKQAVRPAEKATAVNTVKSKAIAKNQAAPNTKTDRQTLVAKKIEVKPTRDSVKKSPAPKKPTVRPKSDFSEIKRPSTDNRATPSDKLIAATSNVNPKTRSAINPKVYDAIGKIDPFEPLFKDKPVSVKKKKDKKKRIPRTPLERIDLSQLKLVGIILASSGNRALVEESSGKGYVIKKGTYIGVNSGKVIKIKKEKVVVEEEFEDVFGKTKLRQREIKLPKPPGEF